MIAPGRQSSMAICNRNSHWEGRFTPAGALRSGPQCAFSLFVLKASMTTTNIKTQADRLPPKSLKEVTLLRKNAHDKVGEIS